jgi:hypothetical protein
MKNLFALTLIALATAACDVGVASSSTIQNGSGASSGPAMCPTMQGGSKECGSSKDCGECLEAPAQAKAECRKACEEPMQCDMPCEKGSSDCQKKCESQQKCEPKAGN